MSATSHTATASRLAKLSGEVRRTLVIAALAIAATAAGIGTAALALPIASGSGDPSLSGRVGDRYFSEPMFRPVQHASTRDSWYLEQRGFAADEQIRDRWYRD